MASRIEMDPLGELAVPSEALWGIQTERARANFPISGIGPHPAFVRATVLIKKAAAQVHVDSGRLESELGQAISAAADEILAGRHLDQFVVDAFQAGAGTSHNMNANEVLANRANELLGSTRGAYRPVHPNDHVNMAQSTNDLIPTAIALAALELLPGLESALAKLSDRLADRAKKWDRIVKTGRTHLQDATPIRLGQEFGAYAEAVRRHHAPIAAARIAIGELSIGGTAVGSGLNAETTYQSAVVARLSQLTGIDLSPSRNLFYSMQSMARFSQLSGALRTLAVDLGRIANDFRLLGSGPRTGLDEMRLPAVQPGSSIMPGKVNPVMAECLNMICLQIHGNDLTISQAAAAGQLELNVMMPVIAFNLCQSIQILASGADVFADRCVAGLEANEAMIAFWLERNTMLATALAPRIGYAKSAEIAKEAVRSGESIPQTARRLTDLSDAELALGLDPEPMTRPGVR